MQPTNLFALSVKAVVEKVWATQHSARIIHHSKQIRVIAPGVDFGGVGIGGRLVESFAGLSLNAEHGFSVVRIQCKETRHATADFAIAKVRAVYTPFRFNIPFTDKDKTAHVIIRWQIARV